MKRIKEYLVVGIVITSVFLSQAIYAGQVAPGEVYDSTNWQKIEDMLPPMVLKDVKKGDFSISIGKLNYSPDEFAKNKVVRDNW